MRKTIVAVGAIVLLSTSYTMAQQREVVRVCAADIRAACGDVAPGAGNIRSCLNSHLRECVRLTRCQGRVASYFRMAGTTALGYQREKSSAGQRNSVS
jgi:hypothetical protein